MPESGTTTVFGKKVNLLQSDIEITDNTITGTSKYVTGYTQFSSSTELQSGNYLALKVTPPEEGCTITSEVIGGSGRVATLDEDLNIVYRIVSNDQKIKFTCYSPNYGTSEYTLNLNLTLNQS